ncbi:hypothetical protein Psed_1812 [Pseudonocardia dioxanivorans CB1190]|uniref:DUF6841 domain-containing protein n=1 Tax=Pseudonocardia dioxanivorans (strain ATCC 55486 / DSM 44775 / JCM 13855 / CB1190) TaxID=675635 RepID=F4CPD1_PSEUX|nr:DUF4440 domain-containing protein [Pseudonocardia dioxanivorans]AEA24046.1 hypothetical protein Psed_1812 [Pseudonocardia dioxanivorans CB1190]
MTTPADAVAVERSVRAAYTDYVACFQRGDPDATAAYFTAPLLRVADGRTTVHPTADDVRRMLAGMTQRLDALGYSGSRVASLEVSVLDRTAALVRSRGTRHDRAGATLQAFDVLYLMARPEADASWRITTLVLVRGAP